MEPSQEPRKGKRRPTGSSPGATAGHRAGGNRTWSAQVLPARGIPRLGQGTSSTPLDMGRRIKLLGGRDGGGRLMEKVGVRSAL